MSSEYPRSRRITRTSEFGTISKKGRRVRALDLDVRLLTSPLKYVRVGIIVPRHGHSAVRRNLLKRRLRELVRTLLLPLQASRDVVIRCKQGAYERTFEELKEQLGDVVRALMEDGTRQSGS